MTDMADLASDFSPFQLLACLSVRSALTLSLPPATLTSAALKSPSDADPESESESDSYRLFDRLAASVIVRFKDPMDGPTMASVSTTHMFSTVFRASRTNTSNVSSHCGSSPDWRHEDVTCE